MQKDLMKRRRGNRLYVPKLASVGWEGLLSIRQLLSSNALRSCFCFQLRRLGRNRSSPWYNHRGRNLSLSWHWSNWYLDNYRQMRLLASPVNWGRDWVLQSLVDVSRSKCLHNMMDQQNRSWIHPIFYGAFLVTSWRRRQDVEKAENSTQKSSTEKLLSETNRNTLINARKPMDNERTLRKDVHIQGKVNFGRSSTSYNASKGKKRMLLLTFPTPYIKNIFGVIKDPIDSSPPSS